MQIEPLLNIQYQILNIPSNGACPWACRIFIDKMPASLNLWFFYSSRAKARNKLKQFKKDFDKNWFMKAMNLKSIKL